ncbi:hypothetical protein FRB98_007445 [Tulasnella sp. 332]|nr:hypothetical protein FRB98_007445 [Tulasnella sp. 332]
MPKPSKSSASSGTRKKYAKRAEKGQDDVQPPTEAQPKQAKAKKADKKTLKADVILLKKKAYKPPVKPSAPRPDPLDALGIASQVPPDFLVVLRRLGKKDTVTKHRALEELLVDWIGKAVEGSDEREYMIGVIELIVPVWLHHYPSLVLHPSRKIRFMAASVYAALLALPSIRSSLFYNLNDTSEASMVEHVLGAWAFSAFDPDSSTSSKAHQSWAGYTVLSLNAPSPTPEVSLALEPHMPSLMAFCERAILYPPSVYAWLNPPAPEVPPAPVPRRQTGRPVTQTGKPKEPEERSKPDAEEEYESDRNARYRMGGMGVLKWLLDTLPCNDQDVITTPNPGETVHVDEQPSSTMNSLASLLSDPHFWTSLYHSNRAPWLSEDDVTERGEGLGDTQPGLRRCAWAVVDSLVRRWLGHPQISVRLLSVAVLRSAWVEPDSSVLSAMWEPLLLLLTKVPKVWLYSNGDNLTGPHGLKPISAVDADAGEDGYEGSDNADNEERIEGREQFVAYEEFLAFLKLGCRGSPRQGYPAVLIITSTLPPEVLPLDKEGLDRLFISLWAAVDGRALGSLERPQNSAAFLSSLLECLILILNRLAKSPPSQPLGTAPSSAIGNNSNPSHPGLAEAIVLQQLEEVCSSLITGRLRTKPESAGEELAKALIRLEGFDKKLLEIAWSTVSSEVLNALFGANPDNTMMTSSADLLAFVASMERKLEQSPVVKQHMVGLILDITARSIGKLEAVADHSVEVDLDIAAVLLSMTIVHFSSVIWHDYESRKRIDDLLLGKISKLFAKLKPVSFISLIGPCLHHTKHRGDIWHRLMEAIGSASFSTGHGVVILKLLLADADNSRLPIDVKAKGGELDALVNRMVDTTLHEDDAGQLDLVKRMVSYPDLFLSDAMVHSIINRLGTLTAKSIKDCLREDVTPLGPLEASLSILAHISTYQPKLLFTSATNTTLLPDLCLLADILCATEDTDGSLATCIKLARVVWAGWAVNRDESARRTVLQKSTDAVKELLGDITVRLKASTIIESVLLRGSSKASLLGQLHLDETVPTRTEYELEYSRCEVGYVDSPMSLLDLDYSEPGYSTSHPSRRHYDRHGYSRYGRMVSALAVGLSLDRQSLLSHLWSLRHLGLLALTAQDHRLMGAVDDPIFGRAYTLDDSTKMIESIWPVIAYASSHLMRDVTSSWHSELCNQLKTGKGKRPVSASSVAGFVGELYATAIATESKGVRDVLVLRWILSSLLRSADLSSGDTEHWLQLGESIRQTAPQTSISIILVVCRLGIQSPRLDRYRNELASHLSGVPSSKANHSGLRLLRQFIATTPQSDSDVELLPQQRAIFLLQAFQKWVASDEELDEEIESLMAHLFLHIAPIVQSVPGAHWDLILDVIETNLENSSLRDLTSLTTITRTIDLVTKLDDLASSNRSLKEIWIPRQSAVLKLVADRLMERIDDLPRSEQRLDVRKVVVSAAKDLPIPIPADGGVSADASLDDQIAAYQLIGRAVVLWNERLVVEAAMDTENSFRCTIPPELLEILPLGVSINSSDKEIEEKTLAFLLSWLVLFDLFVDASVKVKINYLEQLRNLEVLETTFFPNILHLLDVTGVGKPFNLDVWEVEEFDIQKLDDSLPTRLQVLAAHVYYRALLAIPSLIRSWLQDCKDRQVVTTLTSYTIHYFSPIISAQELAPLRIPEAIQELSDEQVKIKVASAANEVTAIYSVDDQPMEILVKLPADFPLHAIEVRGVRKLGVPETKWRAWLFNVQQASQVRRA